MKIRYLILLFILLLFPKVSFAALGDAGNPASSCTHIKDTIPSATDGTYWLQTASMPTAKEYYCDMTTDGGGWMLLFQRRGGNFNNTESCGAGTNDFLHNSCGNVANLSYSDSYIDDDVNTTLANFPVEQYAVIQYDNSMTADTDDAYIINTTSNLFPNLASATVISVNSICHIDATNCDSTNVDWVYAPHGWWNSNGCAYGWNGSYSYKGMYGPCHNGSSLSSGGTAYNVNSFNGNRDPSGWYAQTKLWGLNSNSESFAERVFIRGENPGPTDIILSNNSFDGTSPTPGTVGNLSTIDSTIGDTHSYSFVGVYDNANFSISGSTLQILSATLPSYQVNIRTTDASGNYFDKLFTINITGVNFPGTFTNPILSCQKLKNDFPAYPSGVYWMNNSNMAVARQVYCDQNIAGGGWMLLFQRRGANANTESCGTNLNTFLHNDCGSPYNLGYTNSYSLDVDRTFSEFGQDRYLVVQKNSSDTISSESYIIDSTNNLFPNNLLLSNIDATQICDINSANCDTTNVKWKYTGKSWYASSLCIENNYDPGNSYHGNYGYCHNGYANYSSNSLFGTRSGYSETKLWAYNTNSANYKEMVFVKNTDDIIDPNITSFFPAENQITPGKNLAINLNYTDDDSGINTASGLLQLHKWDNISSSWGANIKASKTNTETITASGTTYNLINLDYGKYKYNFSISDNAGNTSTIEKIFYMDEPKLTLDKSELDLGVLQRNSKKFSDILNIQVKTIGTAFKIYMKNEENPKNGVYILQDWDSTKGYEYNINNSLDINSFSFSGTKIVEEPQNINTSGELNTYNYNLKLGELLQTNLPAGEYEGNIGFQIYLTY